MSETYLISAAVKSTVLLAAGLAVLRLLARRNAGVGALVCLATLASAAAVPLLALWSPEWSLVLAVPASAGVTANALSDAAGTSWTSWIAVVWAIGSVAMAIRAAGGWFVLMRARQGSVPFRQDDGTEIRVSDVSTPLTCGVVRPVILLPEGAREWDDPRLRAVLLHESAHVERRDCLAKYTAQACRALLWWNPLAWMLSSRMNEEQERACDEAVLSAGVAPEDYAGVLLDTAREFSSSLLLGCAMASSSSLRGRLEYLFAWRHEPSRRTYRAAIAIPLLLALMTGVSCAEKVYRAGPGIVPPKVLGKTEPNYTDQARATKLEGAVVLSMIVGLDQRAHDITVIKSLDPGMDANAVASIKTWKFQPGTRNGKPVPVRAKIEVNFRLL